MEMEVNNGGVVEKMICQFYAGSVCHGCSHSDFHQRTAFCSPTSCENAHNGIAECYVVTDEEEANRMAGSRCAAYCPSCSSEFQVDVPLLAPTPRGDLTVVCPECGTHWNIAIEFHEEEETGD